MLALMGVGTDIYRIFEQLWRPSSLVSLLTTRHQVFNKQADPTAVNDASSRKLGIVSSTLWNPNRSAKTSQ